MPVLDAKAIARSYGARVVLDGVSLVPGLLDVQAYADVADVIFLMIATLEEDALRKRD